MAPDEVLSNITWAFLAVILVALLYGFITGFAGVAAMRKRVKRYRKAGQNYERELPAKSGEGAEYPQ